MARLKNFYLYPYSGWEEIPWGEARGSVGPYGDETLDLDAAARTSRRVFEAVSFGMGALGVDSRRSSYGLGSFASEGSSVELHQNFRSSAEGFLGNVGIPKGFRFLAPNLRAELLLGALSVTIDTLATHEGWDPAAARSVVAKFRDSAYACMWSSGWKSSRDRKLRVQITMRLADDGYSRWKLVVADAHSEEVARQTEEVLGWTWIENCMRSFKSMKFVSSRVLEVGSGSGILNRTVKVDIETGQVQRVAPDPVPLSYPGDHARLADVPKLIVFRED
ncbi:MAG: hypothetical protein QOH55_1228 [Microbacteriaceae bacterium]|nr:hypothetical protein [Microbacteriaceae bacterium]